jgi:undecaprenyl-diphosphatase
MDLISVLILAVLQGLTEFLPVSSSGHVVIGAALLRDFGGRPTVDIVEVSVALHVGTLFSILVFYRRSILDLLAKDRRTIILLLVGTIPAVVVGIPLKVFGTDLLESPLLAGVMLPVTGLVLLTLPRLHQGDADYNDASLISAFKIGLAQAIAILPGISRSGMTITAGVEAGFTRRSAATFSFLLAIVAIAGGGVLEAKDLIAEGPGATPLAYLTAGVFVSFLVGLAALWWVVRWLQSGRLWYFAYWCIPVGIITIIWQLVVRFA